MVCCLKPLFERWTNTHAAGPRHCLNTYTNTRENPSYTDNTTTLRTQQRHLWSDGNHTDSYLWPHDLVCTAPSLPPSLPSLTRNLSRLQRTKMILSLDTLLTEESHRLSSTTCVVNDWLTHQVFLTWNTTYYFCLTAHPVDDTVTK